MAIYSFSTLSAEDKVNLKTQAKVMLEAQLMMRTLEAGQDPALINYLTFAVSVDQTEKPVEYAAQVALLDAWSRLQAFLGI